MPNDTINKNLLNFMNTYPLQNDPEFHKKLFMKKEFQDLMLEPVEKDPSKRGDLYQYQKIQKLMFSPETPYKKALINAAPGVGKTCIVSAIVENFKNVMVNGIKRKPALVIVPNTELAKNMMREISDKCTVDLYKAVLTASHVRRGITELTEKMSLRSFKKAFSATYKVTTLEKFFLGKEHKNTEYYSNRIICIDEVHTIREYSVKKGEEDENLYKNVHKFLHKIRDSRIFFFTGTFIWDSAEEAASTLNLLLPENRQISVKNFFKTFFDKNKELTDEGKKILKDSLFLSVLRGMEGAPKTEVGFDGRDSENFISKFKVHPDVFSSFQSKAVLEQIRKFEKSKKKGEEADPAKSYKLAYFNTFVFPKFDSKGEINGYYDDPMAGYNACINNKTYSIIDENLKKLVMTNEGLRKVSVKFASVFDAIENHPEEKAIIYEEFIKGSGTTLMAAIFKARGYDLITSDNDVEKMASTKNKKRVMLITGSNEYKYKGKDIKGGKIINNVMKAVEVYSKPNNARGEHCRIVLGSKKIIIGYSFKETREFHIVEPHWNDPLMDQAEYRGYRAGSFLALQEGERYYKVYRHMTVHPVKAGGGEKIKVKDKDVTYPPKTPFSNLETRDFNIYKVVEEKSVYRYAIIRYAKTQAYDCGLVYKRNVLDTDEDYTKQCDYDVCNYQCEGLTPFTTKDKVWSYQADPRKIDYTTYNAFHSGPEVRDMIFKIKEILQNYGSIDVANIKTYLGEEEAKGDTNIDFIISKAIDTIVSSRTIVRDNSWKKHYVSHHRGKLYLTELLDKSTSSDYYYSNNPIFSKKEDMNSVLDNILLQKDLNSNKICEVLRGEDERDSVSYISQVETFEFTYANKDSKFKSKWDPDYVINNFRNSLHTMKDGTILHTLFVDEFQGTSYTIVQKIYKAEGRFRVFNKDTKTWYFLRDQKKEEAYEKELNEKEKTKKTEYSKFNGVAGFISSGDEKFRIISKYTQKGRVCSTIDIQTITKIFIELGCIGEVNDRFEEKDRDYLLKFIKGKLDSDQKRYLEVKPMIEKLKDKKLKVLCTFLSLGGIASEMCPAIQKILKDNGALNYE